MAAAASYFVAGVCCCCCYHGIHAVLIIARYLFSCIVTGPSGAHKFCGHDVNSRDCQRIEKYQWWIKEEGEGTAKSTKIR